MNMNADLNLNVTRRSEKDMPMTKTTKAGLRWLSLLIAVAVTAVPLAAQAQRKSPLADAPAIRKRYELRASRLEIGAGFGSTINQDFYHTVFLNLKLGFHFNDWLALSAFGGFAVANAATTFQSDLLKTLGGTPATPFEPSRSDALNSMQKINNILGAQARVHALHWEVLAGRVAVRQLRLLRLRRRRRDHRDAHERGHPRLHRKQSAGTAGERSAYYCGVSGSKLAATYGLGLHSYFNHWMALNVELRDMLAKLNPSGRDTNGDLHATTADLTWTHTFIVSANLVFYLPSTPSISF